MTTPAGQTSASPPASQSPPAAPLFGNCWSCRILSGSGLLMSGGYVFLAARKAMSRGAPTTVGNVAQLSFALCLAAWGIVLIADPVGKSQRKV